MIESGCVFGIRSQEGVVYFNIPYQEIRELGH